MRTIDLIIFPVNGGMGRKSVGFEPTVGTKVYDCNVPLNGDYDRGGAYWGGGSDTMPLRVRYTKDLSYIEFYRSYTART